MPSRFDPPPPSPSPPGPPTLSTVSRSPDSNRLRRNPIARSPLQTLLSRANRPAATRFPPRTRQSRRLFEQQGSPQVGTARALPAHRGLTSTPGGSEPHPPTPTWVLPISLPNRGRDLRFARDWPARPSNRPDWLAHTRKSLGHWVTPGPSASPLMALRTEGPGFLARGLRNHA